MEVRQLLRMGQAETSPELIGRDEMNLAEFPITLLTDRSPRNQKAICYEDRHGKLLITGSDAYGLPTAADADVIVALMQLTKIKNDFRDATVNFSRYELLRILNWPDTGKFYKRLTASLYRWSTTSLHYQGTWWDNSKKKNVNVIMHILESVFLVDRASSQSQHTLPLSGFSWNKVFLESCNANNLKNINLSVYFSMNHPSSKRLYRFLDKRFYRGRIDLTFDLREIAFERVGLSRNYDHNAAKIKEKLQPAIDELEHIGFLEPMTKDQRYEKQGRDWTIRIAKKTAFLPCPAPALPIEAPLNLDLLEPPRLVTELTDRGVTKTTAAELVQQHTAEDIDAKIDVFDWLMEKQDKRVAKSPAGYLVKSISDDYTIPKGYISKIERQRHDETRRAAEQKVTEERRRQQQEDARQNEERQAIAAYWESLTPGQQAELDAASLAQADPETLALETGPMKRLSVRIRRENHIRRLLRSREQVLAEK